MNEKITKPTGLYFAEKNEDGSYGDPKPMPGLREIPEVTASDAAEDVVIGVDLANGSDATIEFTLDGTYDSKWLNKFFAKDPWHKFTVAKEEFEQLYKIHAVYGSVDRRKLKRYFRRAWRAAKNWVKYIRGGKICK